jgi:lambda repressor-like predicted transcriptional regulator
MATTAARGAVAIRATGASMANMANGAHSASRAAGAVRGRPWPKGPWL